MKKILILGPFPNQPGGVNTFISLLINNLNKEKFEIQRLNTGKTGIFLKDIFYPFLIIKQGFYLKKIIKNYKPDIVHINPSLVWGSILRDFFFLRIVKRNSIPTIFLINGWRNTVSKTFESIFLRDFFKKNFENADIIIVLSDEFKEKLELLGIKGEKIFIISTMVECNKYFQDNKDFSEPYRVLFCGNIIREKGIFQLIDSIPLILKKYPNVSFTLMGTGRDIEKLKKKTKNINLGKKINILGYKSGEEKFKYFKKSHIFILPSYSEGFPNVVLEAMASGNVIVYTIVGGLKNALINEVNGLEIRSMPPKPNEIARKTLELMAKPDLMKKISINNTMEAKKKYDVKVVSNLVEQIYYRI